MALPQLAAIGSFAGNTPPPRLSEGERTAVKEIVQRFDPQQLTKESAQAINAALEEKGLRPSPGLRDELEANGFDARRLRQLADEARQGGAAEATEEAARPDRAESQRPSVASAQPPPQRSLEGLDEQRFKQLRSAITTYQDSSQTSFDRSQLTQTLNDSGLFNRGSVLDLTL